MKLASLKGGRDGRLVVVSNDLAWFTEAHHIAPTLRAALDHWEGCEPALRGLAESLEHGSVPRERFHENQAASPLPRAYQWADGSAYVNHVALVRRARGAEMPESFWTDPLIYQGGSDEFLGPRDPIPAAEEGWGVDFEAEIAVVLDDVPMGITPQRARERIRLVMLVNDVSLRNLIPAELQGVWILPIEAGFGLLAGRGDTRRAGNSLGRRQAQPAAAGPSQRQGLRQGRGRHRHDVRFPDPDRPCRQDTKLARRQYPGFGHGLQPRPRPGSGASRHARRRRLFLHRRAAHGRNDSRRPAAHAPSSRR